MDKILIVSSDKNREKLELLLKNENLNKYIKDNDIIITLASDNKEEVIKHIDDSSLLVTDYSNVHIKFIEKLKPVIFYQVNNQKKEFANFGKILADEEDVVNRIIGYINMNYKLENIYCKRINNYLKNNSIVYN